MENSSNLTKATDQKDKATVLNAAAIKSVSMKTYVSTHPEYEGELIASASTVGSNEKFFLVKREDGATILQSASSLLYVAYGGFTPVLCANTKDITRAIPWTINSTGGQSTFMNSAAPGNYMSVDSESNPPGIILTLPTTDSSTKFEITEVT